MRSGRLLAKTRRGAEKDELYAVFIDYIHTELYSYGDESCGYFVGGAVGCP